MNKDATLFTVDGDAQVVFPANEEYFTLEEMQGFVGGFIEIIYLPKLDKQMVINEEGKLEGLPLNDLATAILHREYGPYDIIVGNALVTPKEYMR